MNELRKRFMWGMIVEWTVGLVIGAGIAILFANNLIDGYKRDLQQQIANTQSSSKSSLEFNQTTLDALKTCTERYSDLYSEHTILFDKTAGTSAADFLRALGLGQGALGSIVEAMGGSSSSLGIRWEIPVKVRPWVFGNAQGIVFAYIDPKTGKIDGPYLPQVPTAGK